MKVKKLVIKAVRYYQTHISVNTRPRCRFYPTCSNYCIEAVERFGVLKGGFLSLKRILRCNPLFKGGVDLVPEKKTSK